MKMLYSEVSLRVKIHRDSNFSIKKITVVFILKVKKSRWIFYKITKITVDFFENNKIYRDVIILLFGKVYRDFSIFEK